MIVTGPCSLEEAQEMAWGQRVTWECRRTIMEALFMKENIQDALREINGKSNIYSCPPTAVIGPKTFEELLSGIICPRTGVYIIWGDLETSRPLYIGYTTKSYLRILEHWRNRSGAFFVGEIIKSSRPHSLWWGSYFCPMIGHEFHPIRAVPLRFFERALVMRLNPWFWHGGFRSGNGEPPWYVERWLAG